MGNSVPPPPPLNTKAMTPPPENPANEEDKNNVLQYEKWLGDQESAINQHLKYYETEISKLRKLRKDGFEQPQTSKRCAKDFSTDEKNAIINECTVDLVSPTVLARKYNVNVTYIRGWVKHSGKKLPESYKVTISDKNSFQPPMPPFGQSTSLSSKQRTMKKNGNDLNEKDQGELDAVSTRAQEIQKTLEKIRKNSRT